MLSVQREFAVRIFMYALFSPKLTTLFGYQNLDTTEFHSRGIKLTKVHIAINHSFLFCNK